ncbi:DNA-formamidopyrimidine glycosylase family protein [Arsenicicoccus sp. oral taxon 190]|uniref:DNA-formamidopyrimidine glycosylase family protein n=1 Tax=Arsenicicoccus sp. oral taxon 190 TaxID=1658671 RepID=UPI00067A1385|nr:DNA-formamidopyrimidine glycosylase family protein [Arsenicicoccus sp. oral taxon 190]AKT52202.1 DNA glycosylase [Arsenicicoccus sp. oral taxon 190]
MPEGDAVWRTARRLHEALSGRVITDSDLRWPSLATADLRGRTTVAVVPRGKHILHRLDDGLTLHSHLRMEGSWRTHDPARLTLRTLRAADVRAVVGCATATAVGLRLGMLDLVRTVDESRLVGHLGPDLLGADWDPDQAVANLLRQPEREIGAALLDQRNLAGVGTMWDAEVLFLQRVWPWAPVGELGPEELRAVVVRVQALVDASKVRRWSVSTGSDRAGEELYVHGRSGLPCRRCGGPVRLSTIGRAPQDRAMFYCPTCQGGLGPQDDGRRQRPLGEGRAGPSRNG